MIKIRNILQETSVDFFSLLKSLRSIFVKEAQKLYNNWYPDPDEGAEGLCLEIAYAFCRVLELKNIQFQLVQDTDEGHIFLYAYEVSSKKLFSIDLYFTKYEKYLKGSDFFFVKIPKVIFKESDITIKDISSEFISFYEITLKVKDAFAPIIV
jgi:hypothetical protein